MNYPEKKDLSVFEMGILATLNALVGSLKNSSVIDGKELEEVHGHLSRAVPTEARGPIDEAIWLAAIAPLIAKLEVYRD
ncbi:hypothetical protein [Xanthomonas translucens]|uniref:hypothetical protein n=1 Tax=Xanthomonas campestris pv. translucens TaxID=343 RepID=UPI00200B4DCC|nr:hypothetical protein [Xanthomonas translucens]UPU47768.1 hypothetical protein MZO50_13495 [Xanthomonas translucens pv. undulosa]WLA06544.1 hypothetical protein MO329_09845 [Xanthomonas translucens]